MSTSELHGEHFDVLIVGAGMSGLAAAVYLQSRCPTKRWQIVEARAALGGTWDQFRYPGVRSDSNMHAFGYSFKPWRSSKHLASGAEILQYLQQTADDYQLHDQILLSTQVTAASWTSEQGCWKLELRSEPSGAVTHCTCQFLYFGGGYFRQTSGYTPDFPGRAKFAGKVVHPQTWPSDLDCTGKRVVVVGSGATAISLVPALAKTAAHVTLLQRSPSYLFEIESEKPSQRRWTQWLPESLVGFCSRWRAILLAMFFYSVCRRWPRALGKTLLSRVQRSVGAAWKDGSDFSPSYAPWTQRLCIVADGDLFKGLRDGSISLVTDELESFTEQGLRLASGRKLEADVVVTATGLSLQCMGGIVFTVNERRVQLASCFTYKGMMLSGVPNLLAVFGYSNNSWTLKNELTAGYLCRLLLHMDKRGYQECRADLPEHSEPGQLLFDFSSTYLQRSLEGFPKQGSQSPWRLSTNYLLDRLSVQFGSFRAKQLRFVSRKPRM